MPLTGPNTRRYSLTSREPTLFGARNKERVKGLKAVLAKFAGIGHPHSQRLEAVALDTGLATSTLSRSLCHHWLAKWRHHSHCHTQTCCAPICDVGPVDEEA